MCGLKIYNMNWQLLIDRDAEKQLKKIPQKDAERIKIIIKSLDVDPYRGDIEKMEGKGGIWRRRVGSYRILFEILTAKKIIYVFNIQRRTSSTY